MNDPSAQHELDALIQQADEARRLSAFDDALTAYKRALMVSSEDDVLERASIYAGIGETKRAQGKGREAELNYDKALSLMPGYKPALTAMIDIAVAEKDWRRVATLYVRLSEHAIDDDAKADALKHAAEVQLRELSDTRAAIETLERARALVGDDTEVLGALRGLYEKIHRWPKVVEVLGALCTETDDAAERASLRFEQADITLGRLRDEPKGLGFLEAALEEDPTHEKSLVALVAVRTKLGHWADLERIYARLIDRHAERGDAQRAWDVCKRLGTLRRDKLGDGPGAIEAFVGAVKVRPDDAETRAALAELYIAKGEPAAALAELEHAAASAPTRAQTFRRLYEIHVKRGVTDRAWLAALALEELGAADMDHQLTVDQFKPEGALRPTATLDDATWDASLRAPGHDRLLEAMLRAVSTAAVEAKLAELGAARKLVTLDPAAKQDPASTVSIVRTFVWASHVLGIPVPDIYALPDVPGGIAAVPTHAPTTAVGPAVLRNQTVPELAFVVARHLTYFRPEHYPLVFYPTLPELTALFLAMLKVALPEVPIPANESVAKLRKGIARFLAPEQKEPLVAAAKAFEEAGGRADLAQWIRSVELTAHRAALVLCGDFHVAMKRIKGETRVIADVTGADRRLNLVAYLASSGLADARQKLGFGPSPSIRPPPPEAPE